MNATVVKSALLESVPGIVHGFGTATQLIPTAFQSQWTARPQKKQIHCVPILLARRDGAMVAALHGGWRSLYGGIVTAFGSRLTEQGENLSHWVAAIGPAIGPCCYEVQEELTVQFRNRFPHIPPSIISPQFRRLDLAAIIEQELIRLGIGQIDRFSMCTHCDLVTESQFRFRSYRRGDRGPQQHSGLMIVD